MSREKERTHQRPAKRGVSKAEWLKAALDVLERGGVEGIKIERLAATLKIARSGFYWHFKNRQDLLDQMLAYWVHEYTGVAAENPELRKLEPKKRLLRTMQMISDYNLNRFEIPMRAWAGHDPVARGVLDKVYKMRLDFLREAFAELGFTGEDLEMRTRLFVCYHSWEHAMFGSESSRDASRHRKLRLALLTTPLPEEETTG